MTQESWEAMNGLAPRCRLIFSKICSKLIGGSAIPMGGQFLGPKAGIVAYDMGS